MRLPIARRATLDEVQESNRALQQRNERLGRHNEQLRKRNKRLRERNRRLREQVVRLRRRLRRGTELEYVFIVTYGRSGSTLLMGVLDSLPGYLIRGENYEAAYHLFRFHHAMASARSRWRKRSTRRVTHPFFGVSGFPPGRSLETCRRLLVETLFRPDDDTRVTGFKEIRWNQPDVVEYVEWLQQVFPGARFVINTRDLDDVSRSGMWREGDHSDDIRARHDTVLSLAERLGDAAYHVHYDDYVADPTALRGLVEWLGEEWDEESVRAVMEVEHSVHNRREQVPATEGGGA